LLEEEKEGSAESSIEENSTVKSVKKTNASPLPKKEKEKKKRLELVGLTVVSQDHGGSFVMREM